MTPEELKNLILHGNKEIIKEVLENIHPLSLEALFKNIMIKTIGIIRVWYLFYCQLFVIFV